MREDDRDLTKRESPPGSHSPTFPLSPDLDKQAVIRARITTKYKSQKRHLDNNYRVSTYTGITTSSSTSVQECVSSTCISTAVYDTLHCHDHDIEPSSSGDIKPDIPLGYEPRFTRSVTRPARTRPAGLHLREERTARGPGVENPLSVLQDPREWAHCKFGGIRDI